MRPEAAGKAEVSEQFSSTIMNIAYKDTKKLIGFKIENATSLYVNFENFNKNYVAVRKLLKK